MKGWEHAHEIIKKIREANLSNEALVKALGIVLGLLTDGGKDMTDVESSAKLMLVLRQKNGVEEFLAEITKAVQLGSCCDSSSNLHHDLRGNRHSKTTKSSSVKKRKPAASGQPGLG